MTATIVSRDPRGNVVNLDNENVPGVMEPMKMDYPLRGAKVDSLPPDGTAVNVTLHEQDGEFCSASIWGHIFEFHFACRSSRAPDCTCEVEFEDVTPNAQRRNVLMRVPISSELTFHPGFLGP